VDLAERLNLTVRGPAEAQALVFVHGFGCGQDMWRHVAPAFEADFRAVLFDLPGSGAADASTYDSVRHGSLEGYRDDVIALLDEVGLSSVVLVGHSVSAMIAVLVQIARPDLVDRLVLVTPSARYLDDGAYVGGFSEADIDELLDLMSRNHLGWQNPLAALVAGPDSPGVQDELERTFCRARPEVAAEVAPMSAGLYVRDHVPDCELEVLETRGHCPQLSAPEETTRALRAFLGSSLGELTA